MDDPAEHALVVKAFAMAYGEMGYVNGFVEWKSDKAAALAQGKVGGS